MRQEHHSRKQDEYGSRFNFPVTLQRFVPDTLICPMLPDLQPIERDILGYWQSFRDWPQSPANKNGEKLKNLALRRWEICKNENAPLLVRTLALALDLGLTHAIQEVRTPYPWWQVWRRDHIKYQLRCTPHRGLDAFVLTSFNAFKGICFSGMTPLLSQRTLLCALSYFDTPHKMPANAEPAARQAINQLKQHLLPLNGSTQPKSHNPAANQKAVHALHQAVDDYGLNILTQMNWAEESPQATHDGVVLSSNTALMRLKPFTRKLIAACTADMRAQLITNPANDEEIDTLLPAVASTLNKYGWLIHTWEGSTSQTGIFSSVFCNETVYKSCVVIKHNATDLAPLRQRLQPLKPFAGALKITSDLSSQVSTVKQRINHLHKTHAKLMKKELCGQE